MSARPYRMKIVTENEAVAAFRELADMACDTHEPVFIAREGGEAVVLLSLKDYEQGDETEYLLSSAANATRLLESVGDLAAGKPATEHSLHEP